MKRLLVPLLIALLTAVASAQQLLPDNLPACSKQCTVLQQASTGCLPAGGAPQSNQGTYQSCFCQSALLTQLYTETAVTLCSSCASGDMQTIQNWYKNLCGKGGAALPGGNQNNQQNTQAATNTNNAAAKKPTSTSSSKQTKQNSHTSQEKQEGSWISNHWKWIVMLVVIILGLTAFAVAFYLIHRRYHNRRMKTWNTTSGLQPNINTWGPGQSVHDLGWTGGTRDSEKGKQPANAAAVQQPRQSKRGHKDREKGRFSGRFF